MARKRRVSVTETGRPLKEQLTREYALIGGKLRITSSTVFPLPPLALEEFDGLAEAVRALQRESGLSEQEEDDRDPEDDENLPPVTRDFLAIGRRR